MKVFGNSKRKKTAVQKAAPEKRTAAAGPVEPQRSEQEKGLLARLAAKKIEKAREALDSEEYRRRSPEERREIEDNIVRYQKRRVLRRIIILAVIVVLLAGGVVAYKSIIKPPELAGSGSRPAQEQTAPAETSVSTPTGSSGEQRESSGQTAQNTPAQPAEEEEENRNVV